MKIGNDEINLEDLPIVTQKEMETDIDAVLERVQKTSPLRIVSDDGRDLLLFSYEDYKRRLISILGEEYFKNVELQAANVKED